MAYKDLLVVLDSDPGAQRRAELAIELAGRLGAHLIGLYATLVPGRLDRFNAPLFNLLDRAEGAAREHAEAIHQAFDAAARRQGVAAEWRFATGTPSDLALLHGRYADLIVVGQIDRADPEDVIGRLHPEEVALGSGRPVLVVPYAGTFATVGRRVLIGWDGSREATRAVNDALPMMAGAESVTVMTIDGRGHGEVPGADIALHLARHGIEARVEPTVSAGMGAGDILLSRAADLAADLLVIGAYGHTPLRELVLGGATRTILESMTLPVLMSH